jgi:hypothetical protein
MPLWRMRCKDVKETSGVPLVYYARVTSPKKRSGGPAWGPGTASPARARKPLSPFFGGTQFVVEPEASRNTTREPAVPLRRPEKGKPSHFVDWVNRRRYASPNLKRGRQQISFILDQSFRRVSTPFPQIALLAATRFRDRTGTDLEISSSRLYHLEIASAASSAAPRRP